MVGGCSTRAASAQYVTSQRILMDAHMPCAGLHGSLGLLRVKADSAQPATPRGPAADQQPQVADGTADSSAAEAAMQLSTGDPAPQQPAAAQAAATPVADGSTSPPTAGQEPGLANGDPGGDPGADAVHSQHLHRRLWT